MPWNGIASNTGSEEAKLGPEGIEQLSFFKNLSEIKM